MAVEKREFEFPDPEQEEEALLDDEEEQDEKEEEDEQEVEVVDDTPPADRGRKPSDPPEEVTEEELQEYSEKVRRRIQHINKVYHDERRAKEAAQREREALERYARSLLQEVGQLRTNVGKSQQTALDQAKHNAKLEMERAKDEYRDAYNAGDADAILEAQEKLTQATIRHDRVSNFKLPSIQGRQDGVQQTQNRGKAAPAHTQPDAKATAWAKNNTWFGTDDEMTSLALGYHAKLVKQGVNPQSDEYYEKLDSRMRQVFPDSFEDAPAPSPGGTRKSPVATVTRSPSGAKSNKVVLTKSEVDVARRLGITPEQYAREVAALRR